MALNLKIKFDLETDKLEIEDVSNYSVGYTTDVHGVIVITGPGGVLHPGGTSGAPDLTITSADFTPASQASRQFSVTLPSTLPGSWSVKYYVYDNSGAGTVQDRSYAFVYEFTTPACSVSMTVNPAASSLLSTDNTDYTSGAAYTIISNTRTHNIIPPVGAVDSSGTPIPNPADTGSAATLTYTGITTGYWQSSIESVVEWQVEDYYVQDRIACGASSNINSDVGLCDVYCCLKALNLRYEQAKCMNKELAEDYKQKIEEVTRLVTLFIQAIGCGLTGDASQYLIDIKRISECGTECNCYGDGSVPVNIPIVSPASPNTIDVQSGSERMFISSEGSGSSADPVVFSLNLGASTSGEIAFLGGNLQSSMARMSGLETILSSVEELVGETASAPNNLRLRIVNDFTSAGSVVKSKSHDFLSGPRFYTSDKISVSSYGSGDGNWDDYNNRFTVTDLYLSNDYSGEQFYISGHVESHQNLDVEIYDKVIDGYGGFSYRLVRSDKNISNQLLTNQELDAFGDISIVFNIIS